MFIQIVLEPDNNWEPYILGQLVFKYIFDITFNELFLKVFPFKNLHIYSSGKHLQMT